MSRAKGGPWVLGISASHNGAVCLLKGSDIVVAIQEERLTRRKRQRIYGAQPSLALQYCLDYAGIGPQDLDMIALCTQGPADVPHHNLLANPVLHVERYRTSTLLTSHHLAHAASAFGTSGFEDAATLVIDGVGSPISDMNSAERACVIGPGTTGSEIISLYGARDADICPLEKHLVDETRWLSGERDCMPFFRSLGGMYSAVASQIFGDVLEAGKVMGLAPYGRPSFAPDDFFSIRDGRFVFSDRVPLRFRHAERWPVHQVEYQDLAASVQIALEEAVLYLAGRLHAQCPSENLCYAGGVALNSVANERIVREAGFKNVYVMPAAEDSGCAIGAAYLGLWQLTGTNERRKLVHDAVGRPYSSAEIHSAIAAAPAVEVVASDDVVADAAQLLEQGKIVGWFQGGSELGPRALGQRSILSDPRRADGKQKLNREVKRREAFRPFAPVVPLESAGDWFELDGYSGDSPFMLRVCAFKEQARALVPAVVHVDGTGRVQTVTRAANGRYYELVAQFGRRTGVPVLLNTSFNVMGMPIVESPQDALYCLIATGIDYCVLNDTIVRKRDPILLGPEVEPNHPGAPETGAGQRHDTALPARFAGSYAAAAGTIEISEHGGRLTAAWYGQSSALVRISERVFRAAEQAFSDVKLTFSLDGSGNADGLLLERGKSDGSLAFTREPGPDMQDEGRWLDMAGEYAIGPVTLRVGWSGKGLSIGADGLPFYCLQAAPHGRFDLANTPGYSVRFLPDEAAMLVTQPNGTFLLRRRG